MGLAALFVSHLVYSYSNEQWCKIEEGVSPQAKQGRAGLECMGSTGMLRLIDIIYSELMIFFHFISCVNPEGSASLQ